ncbi:MAG: DUF1853 family protein, partial [Sulfuriferula sp.]
QVDSRAGFAGYVGTMTRDRLDLKVAHLRDWQLCLANTPAGAASLPVANEPVRARAMLKGWLFYPVAAVPQPALGLSAHHLQAWWGRWGQFSLPPGLRWQVLPRLSWLTPAMAIDATNLLDEADFVLHLAAHFAQHQTPVLVSGLMQLDGGWREHTRGFIVPSDWLLGSNANGISG